MRIDGSRTLRPIAINGKFYSAPLNGVHRVADRLIRALDHRIASLSPSDRPEVVVHVSSTANWIPSLTAMRVVEHRNALGQGWEQFSLPRLARGTVLISLCNLGPLLHPRQILLVHDAQFFFPDNGYGAWRAARLRLLVPRMAKRAHRLLTVSDYSRDMLHLFGVADRAAIQVIPNGADHMLEVAADPNIVRAHDLVPRRYVAMFGSSKRYKNIAVVLDAFRQPALRNYQLAILGEDEARLRECGFDPPPNARCVGAVGDAALRALYEGALCVAYPSRTEGFGLPPLEAMLLGCPAVVAPTGAIPEVCADAALYAGVDDPREWAEAFVALDHGQSLRAAKIEAGRKRAARFTWHRAGEQLLDVALELAAA